MNEYIHRSQQCSRNWCIFMCQAVLMVILHFASFVHSITMSLHWGTSSSPSHVHVFAHIYSVSYWLVSIHVRLNRHCAHFMHEPSCGDRYDVSCFHIISVYFLFKILVQFVFNNIEYLYFALFVGQPVVLSRTTVEFVKIIDSPHLSLNNAI